jgi:hypothetical protein
MDPIQARDRQVRTLAVVFGGCISLIAVAVISLSVGHFDMSMVTPGVFVLAGTTMGVLITRRS